MQLQSAYSEFTARDAELVALSTDMVDDALRMTVLAGAGFPVLADPDGATARSYGVFNLLGDGVATPATFVVKNDGSVGWSQVGGDIGDRAMVSDILDALDDQ